MVKQDKQVLVSFYIKQDLHRELKIYCAKNRKSITDVLKEYLINLLNMED